MQFRKKLPSLTALVALEAAIRHRSFTLAAAELGVTQAAVSRMIALLEKDFGRPLFTRGHRAIEPTPACQILGATLADSFSDIAEGVDDIRAGLTDVVTIGATIAFSSFWLLPKIAEFRLLHPDIQIRVVSQDSRFDLSAGGLDIVIRYGMPPFHDGTVLGSCGDRIYPVCSPGYAASRNLRDFPAGDYELIETDVRHRGWYKWEDWFARLGRKPEKIRAPLQFSHYTETISAARAGQGIALGWDTLIKTFLKDGSLVKVGGGDFEAEGRNTILVPASTKRSAMADLTAGWLTQALQRDLPGGQEEA